MGQTCQHCGAELAERRDAFCPECRGDLAEPPALPLGYARGGTASATLPDEPGRPGGVGLVAALHILGALAGLLALAAIFRRGDWNAISDARDGRAAMAVAGLVLITIHTTVTGIGLLMGRAWAWWLAAGYYVYTVIHCAWSLALLQDALESPINSSRGAASFVARQSLRAAIHAVILLYLFQPNVRGYFGLGEMRKALALAILTLVGATLVVGTAVLAAVLDA